jgi:hypothetical protein
MSNFNALTPMPWDNLIQAFVTNTPQRMALLEATQFNSTLTELRELRTLTLGGARQSGKTEAVLKFILDSDDAVLFSTPSVYLPYFRNRLGEEFKKYHPLFTIDWQDTIVFSLKDIEIFKNIKYLIVDNIENSTFFTFEKAYATFKEYFHPEFMVIRIL